MRIEELQKLRDTDLLHLARNQSANCRAAAIRLLVERGSKLAAHPDVYQESSALIHSDPTILKKISPVSEVVGRQLPGLLDIMAKETEANRALEQRSSTLENSLTETAEGLRGSIAEKESALKKQSEALGQQLANLCQKLTETARNLESSQQTTKTELERKREELRDEILKHIAGLIKMQNEAYGQRMEKTEARVTRLERSVWRKIIDRLRGQ
jgi:DNA anti-recombination protein RmuC